MHQLKTAIRLAICVGLIASAAIWVALSLGLLQSPAGYQAQHRVTVARYVSVVASSLINSKRDNQLQLAMEQFVASEPTLVSIGIRTARGTLLSAGPHEANWKVSVSYSSETSRSNRTATGIEQERTKQALEPNQVSAELLANGRYYGSIELAFKPEITNIWSMFFGFPVPLATFIGAFVSLVAWPIFERSFKYLDPSQVVPDRVRSALDTMAEGVVLLDMNNEIGHANEAFGQILDREPHSLLGTAIDDYVWTQSSDFGTRELPWSQALKERRPVCGVVVNLTLTDQPTRKFIVNATPIVSNQNECRGVLVSFEDVTAMENKKHELSQMISTLRQSRDEVERQNVKLNFLASYDQLTECLNRREFFKRLEEAWSDESTVKLAIIMVDIDHFKNVNDTHGHGKGDEVLRDFGRLLRDFVGHDGTVARMGGEEFVIMLPHATTGPASRLAEKVRQAVCSNEISGLKITASMGVSSRELRPMDAQHLLDQADQALYTAKNNGRNRVVRYDERDAMDVSQAVEPAATTDEVPFESVDDQPEAVIREVEALLNLSTSLSAPTTRKAKIRSVRR